MKLYPAWILLGLYNIGGLVGKGWNSINSADRRCGSKFQLVILKLIYKVDILSIAIEIALRWMPQDLTDD